MVPLPQEGSHSIYLQEVDEEIPSNFNIVKDDEMLNGKGESSIKKLRRTTTLKESS